MKFVIFGLTITSSWGNGHATLWRGLCRSLIDRGHRVVFFEHDVPYYASTRDLRELPGGELRLYGDWSEARRAAASHLRDADVGIITSYCLDALEASELLRESRALGVFYDLDTPVTLEALRSGKPVAYIGQSGLRDYDLVLSYTGGGALDELRERLHARRVAPLYGHVDPEVHHPVAPSDDYRCDLSYLGTYASDRQEALEALFVEPARSFPSRRFILGGAQYPHDFPWTPNIFFRQHLPPGLHPAFFCSSRMTLNVTRRAMARMGFCPSGRLFEAAACGVPLLSDSWEGLESFFAPGEEIVVARTTEEAVEALTLGDAELGRIARAARERTLAEHTSARRAAQLEQIIAETGAREAAQSSAPGPPIGQTLSTEV
ncbi:MAG TPA: glycosyltransferase [Longimicrobiaceae bacterium]|nr:glycosyltransferase [Longimicrobiaceae bacterium]